jgi:L-ascorbate metabolism protein UlaG (beta-lactamase superfamily)
MKIRWIGHASFQIETAGGLRIRTDPYDASIGLPLSQLGADVVTVSHEHFDHNATDTVPGEPVVLRGEVTQAVRGVAFKGIAYFHDEAKGAKRGKNTIFVITADHVTLAHLGDLGHLLTPDQVAKIGKVDVLLIPVGGTYTLDAATATEVVDTLDPQITIPMHFRTPGLTVGVAPVDRFVAGKSNVRHADEIDVTADTLPAAPEIVVLRPRP